MKSGAKVHVFSDMNKSTGIDMSKKMLKSVKKSVWKFC